MKKTLAQTTRKIVTASLLAAAIAGLSGCGASDDSTKVDSSGHLARANNYLSKKQFRAAMIEVQNVLQADASSAAAHIIQAQILMELGQPKQAINLLQNLTSTSEASNFLLAKAFVRQGKARSALTFLNSHSELGASDNTQYQVRLGEATSALGLFEESEAHFNTALAESPNDAEAMVGLATLYFHQKQAEKAVQILDQLAKTDPGNPQAQLLRAAGLLQQGDLDAAADLLTTLIVDLPATDIPTPIRTKTLKLLIEILTQQGKSSEALIYSQVLSESMPGNDTFTAALAEAKEAYKAKDFDLAAEKLQGVLAIAPGHDLAGTLLATIKYIQGDLDSAEKLFNKHIDAETASPGALQLSAMTKIKMNQPEQVLELLGSNIEFITEPNILGTYAMAAFSANRPEEGKAVIARALTLAPDNVRLLLIASKTYNIQGVENYPKALDAIEKAFEIAPQNTSVQFSKLTQLALMGNHKQAEEFIAALVKNQPDIADTRVLAGQFYATKKSYVLAKTQFDKALALEPTNIKARVFSARLAMAQKDFDGAIAHWETLIKQNDDTVDYYRGLMASYVSQKEREKGHDRLGILAGNNSENAAPLIVLAEISLGKNDLEGALASISKVDAQSPSGANHSRDIIRTYQRITAHSLKSKAPDKAREAALKGLAIASDNLTLLNLLSTAEIASGNFDEAEKVNEQIAKVDTEGTAHALLSGQLAERKKQPTVALSIYKQQWEKKASPMLGSRLHALLSRSASSAESEAFVDEWMVRMPELSQPFLLKAMSHQGRQEIEQAKTRYFDALKISPNSPVALNNLAFLLGEEGDPQALDMALRAHTAAPNNPQILDTYGWMLVEQGQQAKGIELLKQATKNAPTDTEIRAHLDEAMSKK